MVRCGIIQCVVVAIVASTAVADGPDLPDPRSNIDRIIEELLGALPPANDDCADAIAIAGEGTFFFSNRNATTDGLVDCQVDASAEADVWYCWTAECTGVVTLSTCGQIGFDSAVAIYDGCGCPAGERLIACNDDGVGCYHESFVTWEAVAGSTYLLRIGAFDDTDMGEGSFTIACPPGDGGGDGCDDAEPIEGEGPFLFDLTGTRLNGEQDCEEDDFFTDVYFCWTAPCTGPVQLSTCNQTDVDTIAAVYADCLCPPAAAPIVCNRDAECDDASVMTWEAEAGSTYLVRLGASSAPFPGPGRGSFTITCLDPGGDGGVDDCQSGPEPICGQGIFYFDNTDAATDGPEDCVDGDSAEADLWYCWTADATGIAALTLCQQTAVDTVAAVYDGCGCPGGDEPLACNDDAPFNLCDLASFVAWDAVEGSSYLIRIGSFDESETGSGSFTITVGQGAGGSDDCEQAEEIAGDGVYGYDLRGASLDGVDDVDCSDTTFFDTDVWFCWTAQCDGVVTLTNCQQMQEGLDTIIAVYDGCGCPQGNGILDCNDDGEPCDLESYVSWIATAGDSYLIRIGDFGGAEGVGTFTVMTECGTGACCLIDDCEMQTDCVDGLTASECERRGGDYQGDGTTCGDVTCEVAFGACCVANGAKGDGGCLDGLDEAACTEIGGLFQGPETSCNEVDCDALVDCNGNGVDDAIDIATGTSEDCNEDGIPDECPACPEVDVVLVFDTSGSIEDEAVEICESIGVVDDALQAAGIDAELTLWGITFDADDEPEFFCLTNNVLDVLGNDVPGNGACGPLDGNGDSEAEENWGPGTAVVAERFPWRPEALRLIIAVSDEGPCLGDRCEDPGPDRDSVENAINVALAQEPPVIVSTVAGTGSEACVIELLQDLADATGGTTALVDDVDELPGELVEIVLSACVGATDCNGNGVPDECDVEDGTSADANDNGIPDECEVEDDCNGNGIDDLVETAPEYDPLAALASDLCGAAEFVCTDIIYAGDTFTATPSAALFCGLEFLGQNDVYYRYRPKSDGTAVVKVCDFAFVDGSGSPVEHVGVSIHTGCPATAANQVACNFASSVLQNCGAIWSVEAGVTYFVRVAGEDDSRGTFELEVKGPPCLLNPLDVNENRVPDECDCLADVNGDGVVDATDIGLVAALLGTACERCPEDVNSDGVVDEQDLAAVYAALGPCPFG